MRLSTGSRRMQVRASKSTQAKVEQQMTPLIDVVFQLLVFFVMSFKVASLEGDFNVQMPLAADGSDTTIWQPPSGPLKLRLTADADGELTSLALNQRQFAPHDWQGLQRHLMSLVGTAAGPDLRDSLE